VIAASGIVAEKTSNALEKYNALSRRARAAAEGWRQVSGEPDETLADAIARAGGAAVRAAIGRAKVDGYTSRELQDRFDQFHEESEVIVPAVTAALARGDLAELGRLIDQSQQGAESLLGNQISETISLARSARELGAVAASAFGAGFGGSVWALVRDADVETFVERWRETYLQAFPTHRSAAQFFATRAGPPASRLA